MENQTRVLSDVSADQWRVAFDDAMANTDFDGLFHRLYQAVNTSWYTGPKSARELADQLFAHLMNHIFNRTKKLMECTTDAASGCLRIELRVYADNYQCHIYFNAATAHGMCFVRG